ncbi:hypothetical protein [Zobellia laminariae]|uniref:hypothetical protein n=1 Tax=Zobellia laminariae TaxID=248906 RepID=UPI0026F41071|nr:hypothetical protein [Zobellia laminariae]WKX78474.1 hypothetical protein Q5W13_11675 [Zobellia laminariae]
MKNLLKFTCCLFLLAACKGNKEDLIDQVLPAIPETELGAFNLVFPDNNLICTEGEDQINDELAIEFLWSKSTSASSYKLDITNQNTGKVISTTSNTESKSVTLPKDTQFSWSVTAVLEDQEEKSTAWSFYSEGIAEDNFAPFPAEISITDNTDGTVKIDWPSTDLDNDIVSYDIYWGTTATPELLLSQTKLTSVSNHPIEYGTTYYIVVITQDTQGNSSTSKTQFTFEN